MTTMLAQARRECALRSARTQITERPGGLPGTTGQFHGGQYRPTDDELRKRICTVTGFGPVSITEICEYGGNHKRVRTMVADMVSSGHLVKTTGSRSELYEVAK